MASMALRRITTRLLTPDGRTRVNLAPHALSVHVSSAYAAYRRRVGTTTVHAQPARPWAARRHEPPRSRAYGLPRLAESSSSELLRRLNQAYGRPLLLTHLIGVAASGALATGSMMGAGWYATSIFTGAAALVLWYVRRGEDAHYGEVVEYQLEPDVAHAYRKVVAAFQDLASSGPVWRVEPTRRAFDDPVRRTLPGRAVTVTLGLPRRMKSNIIVPMLPGRRHVLCFFPDRLLVYERQMVWAVSYRDLKVKAGDVRALDDGREAAGGLNGYLVLEGRGGLHEIFRCADVSAVEAVAAALHALPC